MRGEKPTEQLLEILDDLLEFLLNLFEQPAQPSVFQRVAIFRQTKSHWRRVRWFERQAAKRTGLEELHYGGVDLGTLNHGTHGRREIRPTAGGHPGEKREAGQVAWAA